jgi:hypothetical protein
LDEVIDEFEGGQYETVPEKLFDLYNNNLQKAIGQVFKKETLNEKYKQYYYQFEVNAAKFAAYKSNYAGRTLWNAYARNPRSFKKNAKAILKAFNRYQLTEYNTTVARCRTARQFVNFKENQDLYPCLEWLRSRSANPRELHASFVGIILPIDHPFWRENQPGNLYNCKCNWRQSNATPTGMPLKSPLPAKGLDGNPAISRKIFTENHPYFTKAMEKEVNTIDNFITDHLYKTQFEKTAENIFVHKASDPKASDFNDLLIVAKEFAKRGKPAYIMPRAYKDSDMYYYLFKNKGADVPKCPDLFIGGSFYEYESFTGKFNGRKRETMIMRGLKQSDRIIIDVRNTDINERHLIKRIHEHVDRGEEIQEVWILVDGNIIQRIY